MLPWFVLILCASLCVGDKSQFKSGSRSAQKLWEEAWSTTLQQNGIDESGDAMKNLPSELQDHLQHKAEKLWRSWLQHDSAASSTVEYSEPSTTVNGAMARLLAGVEPGYAAPVADAPAFSQASVVAISSTTTSTTVTTSTEDAKAKLEQEQQQARLLELKQSFVHRLTAGLAKDDQEDATATTTTTTAVTTTTTENLAFRKLLAGVDAPAPISNEASTTLAASTTTTSTTTETIGAAGKKTLAFLMQGTSESFVMPHHSLIQTEQVPDDNDDGDDDQKSVASEDQDGGQVAGLLDMDNAS